MQHSNLSLNVGDLQLGSGCFSSKGLKASWGHVEQHRPLGWKNKHRSHVRRITLHVWKWADCAAFFFFSQTHTHRTGCPWVSLHPVRFPLLAIPPWEATEKVNISWNLSSRAENVQDDLLNCFIFSAWYKQSCENSFLCSLSLLQHPVCDVQTDRGGTAEEAYFTGVKNGLIRLKEPTNGNKN